MIIPTLLAQILGGKADWQIGRINRPPKNKEDFIVGEEILFLKLGEGETVLAHKMPRIDRNTRFNDLHTSMIRDGIQIPFSCITAHSKK